MADEKTTKTPRKVTKTAAAETKAPAEKKAAAEKKPAAEKKAAAEKKPAARKTAEKKTTRAAGTRAKKPAKAAVITLDDLTTAIWEKLEKKDVKDIPPIAIQVNVYDTGFFYIAVNVDPEYDKQVIQSKYELASGFVDASAEEIKKIAAGGYDFIEAVKTGKFSYHGNLAKGIIIAELIK